MYSKTLTVNKGVDNVLLFEFINQDQKPVNITGSSFVFRLLNQSGDAVLLSKEMTALSAALGRVKVVLDPADTDIITSQPASYSIVRTAGDYEQAVFTDANSSARATCNIVDSVLPQFIPSKELTVPDVYGKEQYLSSAPDSWPDWALNPPGAYGNVFNDPQRFSSHVNSNGSSLTTFQMEMDHFTGNVKAQGAQTYESVWYNIGSAVEYFDETGPVYLNVEGFHPLIRLAFNNQYGYGATATATVVDGEVTGISLNYPGLNYIAAPYIQILGDGTGATATATVAAGGVSTITVTNGGIGYVPIQLGSPISARVLISNGIIQYLEYR